MALRRCEYEALPADADVDVASMFAEMKALELPGVTWLGFRKEPLFFGLEKLIAACTVDESLIQASEDDASEDKILQALTALESVQSSQLLSSDAYEGDPFEICCRLFRAAETPTAPLRDLCDRGIAIVDDFLPAEVVATAAGLVHTSLASFPEFVEDGIPWRLPEPRTARSDVATWLVSGQRPASDAVFAEEVLPAFQRLVQELRTCMHLQGRSEQQLAWYPAKSSGYRRHTDAFADGDAESNQRKVTAILYLNDHWVPEHGGGLRLWLPQAEGGAELDVEPLGGRLLLFLSGCIKHEVLPCYKDRCALTNWIW